LFVVTSCKRLINLITNPNPVSVTNALDIIIIIIIICTIDLVQSLMNMFTNLTKEVTDLKNDNALLKQEIKNLHGLIEASPRPTSQYITGEQRFLPAEMSHKGAASVQRVLSAALPAETLPTISIPAGLTLSYRDLAAAGIPPSGPTALPDADGFKTVSYRKETVINRPPAEISAINKVKPRR
jgi:predicted PurR-regulated permease PerM